jgi:hypothetical protein
VRFFYTGNDTDPIYLLLSNTTVPTHLRSKIKCSINVDSRESISTTEYIQVINETTLLFKCIFKVFDSKPGIAQIRLIYIDNDSLEPNSFLYSNNSLSLTFVSLIKLILTRKRKQSSSQRSLEQLCLIQLQILS